jgi:hypothetical protein
MNGEIYALMLGAFGFLLVILACDLLLTYL